MTYDTTEAVAKFLSGFQMKTACRHRQPLEMCMETGEGKAPPVFC